MGEERNRGWLSIGAALVLLVAPLSVLTSDPGSASATADPPTVEWADVLETQGADSRFWATNVTVGDDGTIVVAAGEKLVAYSPDGTILWTNRIGADSRDVTIDAAGDIIVVGAINEPGTFGQGSQQTTLTPPRDPGETYYDLVGFLAKYDSAGALEWAKLEGTHPTYPEAVTTASDGRIVATGGMDGDYWNVVLGSGSNEITLTGEGAFVATYSPSGTLENAFVVEWPFPSGVTIGREPRMIDLEFLPSGDLALGGTYSTVISSTFSNTSIGGTRMYLASVSLAGSINWAHTTFLDDVPYIGTFWTAYGGLGGMAVDDQGNILVTGGFEDPGGANGVRVFGEGDRSVGLESDFVDVFVASYDSNGELNWANRAGGASEDVGSDIVTTPQGDVIVAGRFGYLGATFGTGATAVTVPAFPSGYEGTFVATYHADGMFDWVSAHERRDSTGRTILNGDVSGPRIALGPTGGLAVNDILEEAITLGDGDGALSLTPTTSPNDVYLARYAGVVDAANLVPVVPARFLETRTGPDAKTIDGLFEGDGRAAAGATTEFTVAGRGEVPEDASAVFLNVVAAGPADGGYLTVFPCDEERPLAANVNYGPGELGSNAVLAKTAADGSVCVFSFAETDLIIDVNGYVPAGGSPSPVVPARVFETRRGEVTVDGVSQGVGRVGAGEVAVVDLGGRAGVPEDASAVFLNVVAAGPADGGYLTVFPCDEERPLAANVNYGPGELGSNAVLAKTAADGSVCVFSFAETDLIIDVNGYVPAGGSPSPVVPARVFETRRGEVTVDGVSQGVGRVGAGEVAVVDLGGRAGVPEDASAVFLNVVAAGPADGGYLTVFPCDEERPLAANVNYGPGELGSNAVLAKTAADGSVCVFSFAETDLIIDVNGYVPS